jgi:hypothetical protein
MKQSRVVKFLSPTWWESLTEEEVEQEELIQLWRHPELAGHEGLLAYCELLYKAYKEGRIKDAEEKMMRPEASQTSREAPRGEVLLDPNDDVLIKLTSFERYVLLLVSEVGATGASKILQESPRVIDYLLKKIRDKLRG